MTELTREEVQVVINRHFRIFRRIVYLVFMATFLTQKSNLGLYLLRNLIG